MKIPWFCCLCYFKHVLSTPKILCVGRCPKASKYWIWTLVSAFFFSSAHFTKKLSFGGRTIDIRILEVFSVGALKNGWSVTSPKNNIFDTCSFPLLIEDYGPPEAAWEICDAYEGDNMAEELLISGIPSSRKACLSSEIFPISGDLLKLVRKLSKFRWNGTDLKEQDSRCERVERQDVLFEWGHIAEKDRSQRYSYPAAKRGSTLLASAEWSSKRSNERFLWIQHISLVSLVMKLPSFPIITYRNEGCHILYYIYSKFTYCNGGISEKRYLYFPQWCSFWCRCTYHQITTGTVLGQSLKTASLEFLHSRTLLCPLWHFNHFSFDSKPFKSDKLRDCYLCFNVIHLLSLQSYTRS